MRMTGSGHRRRVAPLFWFKDIYGHPFDSARYMLPGPSAFCFFSSESYAEDFFQQWLDAARSGPVSHVDWGIYRSDDPDYLLEVCCELAQIPGTPRPEGFLIGESYEYFFVDPPLNLDSTPLPKDLDAMNDEIRRKAEDGTSW
jgi:hypothetical protein